MSLPDLPPLREVIAAHGLQATKALGQNFLLDEQLLSRIATIPGPLAGREILEIGPGPGGLTRALLETEAASVTAVEIDPRAVAAIRELQEHHPTRLHLVEGDALKMNLPSLAPAPRQIIANLPYNAATPMLVAWLRQAAAWERLTLMFQLEVAERICASPDTEAYGRLSVLAQLTCRAGVVMRLPPSAFTPPPAVVSAVVAFIPHPEQPEPALFSAMERLTAAAFGQRRKMLRGSLRAMGGQALLARAGIDGERRAETLSVEELTLLAALTLEMH